MKTNPICPICGTILEEDDCYDADFCEDRYIAHIIGYCSKCKKNYKWKKIFDFSENSNLESDPEGIGRISKYLIKG